MPHPIAKLHSDLSGSLQANLAQKDTRIITLILLALAVFFFAVAFVPGHWWVKAGVIAWAVLP